MKLIRTSAIGIAFATATIFASGSALAQAAAPAAAPAPQELKDCAECPTMVVVPGGKMMRSLKYGDTEYPVEIRRPFAMSKYEVTWEEFNAFAKATSRKGKDCIWFQMEGDVKNPDKDWDNAFPPDIHTQYENEPVLCVSFDDAQAYVAWLRDKTGEAYRLPTEAEWEWAARGGSPNDAFWWQQFNMPRWLMAMCNDCHGTDTMGRDDELFTTEVGHFPPNAFGLYDMGGNAGEWVQDCYNTTLNGAPKDGTAWLDGDCSKRVVRGGSWHDERHYLAAYREPSPVGDRNNDIGIRLVKSLPE